MPSLTCLTVGTMWFVPFLNLQIMHVLQYSRCLHSIKHLTKPASVCLGMSVLTGVWCAECDTAPGGCWLQNFKTCVWCSYWQHGGSCNCILKGEPFFGIRWWGCQGFVSRKVNAFEDHCHQIKRWFFFKKSSVYKLYSLNTECIVCVGGGVWICFNTFLEND